MKSPNAISVPPRAGGFSCLVRAWQTHEAELRAYLRHRLADDATADDVLQDVFLKAMKYGAGFCRLDNQRAWLFQVARNTLVDRLRAARADEPLSDAVLDSVAHEVVPTAPIDALADCVARTLGELPAADAAILRACDIEGQTLRVYTQAQGLSLAAGKSRLLRARLRLRERITRLCRVQFEADGSIGGHQGRLAAAGRFQAEDSPPRR